MLLDAGRVEDVVAERCSALEYRTLHGDYAALRKTAERAGRWPDLREWALGAVRAGRRSTIELRLGMVNDKYRYNRAVKTIVRLGDAYRRSSDEAGFRAT